MKISQRFQSIMSSCFIEIDLHIVGILAVFLATPDAIDMLNRSGDAWLTAQHKKTRSMWGSFLIYFPNQ